uniref:Uncharacterized protein n=1 Tax=Arundo donax TaxID=35708 RepID=A0A0A9G6A5_ARUDO
MSKGLPIGVGERVADHMSACWISSNCSITVFHPHSSALEAGGQLGLVERALLLHLRELARHAVVGIHRWRAPLLVAGATGLVSDWRGGGGAL